MPLVSLLHSVDSSRLFSALEEWCTLERRSADVLLEVNASREPNKYGFKPEELTAFLDEIRSAKQVHVRGLMTMAAYDEDPERCRPTFAELRRLREELRGRLQAPHDLTHLSMGMSNDFEVAIEEGATLVRVGTALFEGLDAA
jgi:pyridoxal phosphate enzyme (YggS family)